MKGGTIYLTGFMGTGKTAAGRLLARRLGRPFLDLDAAIERRSGRTVAELFARGERSFRRRESAELRRAAGGKRVVALGGGALLDKANRELVERTGVLIALTCARPELWRRLKKDIDKRPLLAGGHAQFGRLLASRRDAYRSASFAVSTTRRSAAAVAVLIARRLA